MNKVNKLKPRKIIPLSFVLDLEMLMQPIHGSPSNILIEFMTHKVAIYVDGRYPLV